MYPILPGGARSWPSIARRRPPVAPGADGRGLPDDQPMIRWLELSGRHMILRPNQPSREHPLIPVELNEESQDMIIGQVSGRGVGSASSYRGLPRGPRPWAVPRRRATARLPSPTPSRPVSSSSATKGAACRRPEQRRVRGSGAAAGRRPRRERGAGPWRIGCRARWATSLADPRHRSRMRLARRAPRRPGQCGDPDQEPPLGRALRARPSRAPVASRLRVGDVGQGLGQAGRQQRVPGHRL